MSRILTVVKRDGREAPYDEQKIADAIFKAAQAVGGEDRQLAAELASVVSMFLEREFPDSVPGIEDIQDVVERVLIETGHARTAKAYILYREKRARRREALRVRKAVRHDKVSTDISLLVDPGSRDELLGWDRQRIVDALVHEADLDEDAAQEIARAVEQKIFDAGIN
ncbi:hypothetical protein HQ576_11100, partial [bacterium]|nr:hypothetical protein [bacterium]